MKYKTPKPTARLKNESQDPVELIELMSKGLPDISKIKLKKCIGLGGVWLIENKKRTKRIKKIKHQLEKDATIEVFYNPNIKDDPERPEVVFKTNSWGIWYKPGSLAISPTPYSDKYTLETCVKERQQKCHIINRLDYETEGLVIVAYNSKQAAKLSLALQENSISKYYLAEVLGHLEISNTINSIDTPIDNKIAKTEFKVIEKREQTSIILAKLVTGRLHQIRRHFNSIGNPVVGDPKYGKGNQNTEGLMLQCLCYKLKIPNSPKEVRLPDQLIKKRFGDLDLNRLEFF